MRDGLVQVQWLVIIRTNTWLECFKGAFSFIVSVFYSLDEEKWIAPQLKTCLLSIQCHYSQLTNLSAPLSLLLLPDGRWW